MSCDISGDLGHVSLPTGPAKAQLYEQITPYILNLYIHN